MVYAAFPFCIPTEPKDCGFCPFPKVDLGDAEAGGTRSAAVRRYLDHLYREIDLTAPHLGLPLPVDSVYFGGGTPNLLNPDEATEIVSHVLAAFPPSAGAEVTFEGIPYLFTQEEKIAALKAAGVNRLSIGAQQLEDHLIRSRRPQHPWTRHTVKVAVEPRPQAWARSQRRSDLRLAAADLTTTPSTTCAPADRLGRPPPLPSTRSTSRRASRLLPAPTTSMRSHRVRERRGHVPRDPRSAPRGGHTIRSP